MKNLKLVRNNTNLTQDEVAKIIGIPKTTYANYEQIESCVPPIGTLFKIADYFGCSVDYLIGHETQDIIHLDSLTPLQKKIFNMVRTLNDDQSAQVISICSYVLGVPYDKVKPERPW